RVTHRTLVVGGCAQIHALATKQFLREWNCRTAAPKPQCFIVGGFSKASCFCRAAVNPIGDIAVALNVGHEVPAEGKPRAGLVFATSKYQCYRRRSSKAISNPVVALE